MSLTGPEKPGKMNAKVAGQAVTRRRIELKPDPESCRLIQLPHPLLPPVPFVNHEKLEHRVIHSLGIWSRLHP